MYSRLFHRAFYKRMVAPTLLLMMSSCQAPPSPSLPSSPPLSAPDAPVVPLPVVIEVPEILETQTGLASYYHPSLDGLETASGIPYDNDALMAAHPSYPLGTLVRVTNLEKQGAIVELRITDRGPTGENVAEGVMIDLSGEAARQMDMLEEGRVQVRIEVLDWGSDERQ
jgi:rare lipoprotein A